MAKTRAQRKAEKRKREERRQRRAEQRVAEAAEEGRAQHDTQNPVSGEVAEAEAVIETGAVPEEYGEHTVEHEVDEGAAQERSPVPGVMPEPVVPEQEPVPEPPVPEPPAPSRADVGRPDGVIEEAPAPARESREERRARRQREKEERRKARAKEIQKAQRAPAERAEKRRGPVVGFIASCWAELKRVQWPVRDTLVQASAVTLIFVAACAAYLGGLDAAFNWLIKQII